MGILASAWLVLFKEWNGILGILGVLLLGGGIVFYCLKFIFDDHLTLGEFLGLGLGGAFLPLFFGIFLSWLINLLLGVKINFIFFCAVIFIAGCFAYYQKRRGQFQTQVPESQVLSVVPGLVLILILLGSLFARLAFISELIAPLYADSAVHYSIVKNLMNNFETSSLPSYSSFLGGYYHLGFHFLAAALSQALHLDAKDVMLIFGQILVAILPLPLFFIVRQETKLDAPGIFTVLLAGWGWGMPAHAINWGKYPALSSVLVFEFVVCSLYLALRSSKSPRWPLMGLLGLGILISTFIHSRSLILIAIALASYGSAVVWRRLPLPARILIFSLALGSILLLIFQLQSKPVFNMIFYPYWGWMLFLILLLLPFAVREFSVAALSNIFSISFLLGSLSISASWFLPAYDVQTLLDRPFVEMVLFFPLAFLGGLGYAGMVRVVNNFHFHKGLFQKYINGFITISLFGAVLINFTQYKFSPSTCCKYFWEEDAVAIDWMDRKIPLDAKIVISQSESTVFESTQSIERAYSDAGTWVLPLIQRSTAPLPYHTDFSAEDTLDVLCNLKATYIYIGGRSDSFDLAQIQGQPGWYEMQLLMPKAQVFKVIACR
jgi:hypothetical protein